MATPQQPASPYPSVDPVNVHFIVGLMYAEKTEVVETTLDNMEPDELSDFMSLLFHLLMLAQNSSRKLTHSGKS